MYEIYGELNTLSNTISTCSIYTCTMHTKIYSNLTVQDNVYLKDVEMWIICIEIGIANRIGIIMLMSNIHPVHCSYYLLVSCEPSSLFPSSGLFPALCISLHYSLGWAGLNDHWCQIITWDKQPGVGVVVEGQTGDRDRCTNQSGPR